MRIWYFFAAVAGGREAMKVLFFRREFAIDERLLTL